MACLSCPPSEVAKVNNSSVIKCKAGTRNYSTALLICQMVCSSYPCVCTVTVARVCCVQVVPAVGQPGCLQTQVLSRVKDDAEEVDEDDETNEKEDDEAESDEASGSDDDWPW